MVALVAKTMIRHADIRRLREEPTLLYPPNEPPPHDKVETKAQEEARTERNRMQRQQTKDLYDRDWKFWKNSSASGLDLTAANERAKSILFMKLGTEGQRRYEQKMPHEDIEDLSFDALWHQLDAMFFIKRNITVDGVIFLSRRQREAETLEHFHAALTALAAKCQFRDLETELVRDLFITNITDLELQRKFLRRAMDAEEVLETAIAWERGMADQTSIEHHSKAMTANASILPGVLETARRETNVSEDTSGGPTIKINNKQQRRGAPVQNCRNCGNQFGPNHIQRCPARGQSYRNCGKPNHFARMSRSAQNPQQATGKQQERPKRMRFIEQDDDVDDLLEAETQVRAISSHEREEGEIVEADLPNRDVLDINMQENWDDYGILAVNNKKGTPRYMVELQMNAQIYKFMIDTGSPASFIDHKTAHELHSSGAATLRDLNAEEARE